ncbi:MAG: glycosyltransferase family 39 protein [Flavipsychrobacter sp.]|nr:glycosyltransferase family 39 protein [Flavipsychrobacter sp.]
MDEVNLVMNIYDHPFQDLFGTLDNHQYPPPGFLIIIKVFSALFGFSEYALRLYPFLCGIVALWLFYKVLKEYVSLPVLLYPLSILALGFIYIRYSAVVKQYSMDMVVVQSLILLAIKWDVADLSQRRFSAWWIVVGMLAIWSSMPSVFVLAAIWTYYFLTIYKSREYKKIFYLALIGAAWLLNFWVYYETMLLQQIESGYLQFTTRRFRLNVTTLNPEHWKHNWLLIKDLLVELGGDKTLSIIFHIAMAFLGGIYLFRNSARKAILLAMPVALCFLAVCLGKYTMMVRVWLFTFPLMLALIGVGIQVLAQQRGRLVKIVAFTCCLICTVNVTDFKTLAVRTESEEITRNMDYALKWNITSENLYVQWSARYAFRYYTTAHPRRDQWNAIKDATVFTGFVNFDSLSATFKGRTAVLFGGEEWDLFVSQLDEINKNAKELARNNVPVGWIFIYDKK